MYTFVLALVLSPDGDSSVRPKRKSLVLRTRLDTMNMAEFLTRLETSAIYKKRETRALCESMATRTMLGNAA